MLFTATAPRSTLAILGTGTLGRVPFFERETSTSSLTSPRKQDISPTHARYTYSSLYISTLLLSVAARTRIAAHSCKHEAYLTHFCSTALPPAEVVKQQLLLWSIPIPPERRQPRPLDRAANSRCTTTTTTTLRSYRYPHCCARSLVESWRELDYCAISRHDWVFRQAKAALVSKASAPPPPQGTRRDSRESHNFRNKERRGCNPTATPAQTSLQSDYISLFLVGRTRRSPPRPPRLPNTNREPLCWGVKTPRTSLCTATPSHPSDHPYTIPTRPHTLPPTNRADTMIVRASLHATS